MSKCQRSVKQKYSEFPAGLRSFIGYLEGSGKSLHTIKSYRLDLLAFQEFLEKGIGRQAVSLKNLEPDDLNRFHDWLREQKLKSNTRRRILLTVQRFLNFLSNRKKLPDGIARKYPTPHKIERVPLVVSTEQLIQVIKALPCVTPMEARNRVLLWALAETGCQVSEVIALRYEDFNAVDLRIAGKAARTLPVSRDLNDAVLDLQNKSNGSPYLFLGFNRFGPLKPDSKPMTPRAVELLVKHHSARLGFPELTPRTFRHSRVVQWHIEGLSQKEIQERLGLKTDYAFRVYGALLRNLPNA